MMRCMKFQNNKKHLNTKEDAGNVIMTASDRENKKNDNSPQSHRECPIPDYSTPVRRSLNNTEESPCLDYCSSPTLLPCTQEGGIEVAWDWHNSLSKTSDSWSKKQNIQCETPKGTKLLQKKRNSNSPLLYKPVKRKTMESIYKIGQFAAELQALDKKVRISRIKQNDGNHLDDVKEDTSIMVNAINDEEKLRIENNEQNLSEENNSYNNVNSMNVSYDDLFDDSIDDSMAKCTQEIEKKFNLVAVQKDSTAYLEANIGREKLSYTNNIADKTSPQFTSNENSRKISVKSPFCDNTNDNNTLKIYSKLSLKKDVNSSIHIPIQKDAELHQSCMNNMSHYHIEKPCDKKSLNHHNATFDIPDDSFDDCLATCIEDEKLLSALTESNNSSIRRNDSAKYETNYKYLTHIPLKKKLSCNSITLEPKSTNFLKSMAKAEMSTVNFLENRRFFKTKSLSDQYIGQGTIINAKNMTNRMCYTKSTSYSSSLSKNSTVSYTNVPCASVSTNLTAIDDYHKIENSTVVLMCNADRMHDSDVNRFMIKESGNRLIKYNSIDNIKNATKEMTKTDLQQTQCTAEEIERKRIQAKMRLEAKRRLYSMKVINNINR